jgi:uncharacterized protein YbjT (DUF2867 family)
MMKPLILVASAAGLTGGRVARLLIQRGFAVRALVRQLDERAERLLAAGAEVVQGDLLNQASVLSAFADVRRAYFAYPIQDGLLEATAVFASAARTARTEIVVNLSQLQNPHTPASRRNGRHILADQLLEWADVKAVSLQAAMFYSVLGNLTQRSISSQNTVYLPLGLGDALIPLIAAHDVANVAAAILAQPSIATATSYSLVGDLLTVRQLVDTFSEVLGLQINYIDLPNDKWRQAVTEYLNPYVLDHLAGILNFFRTADTANEASFKVSQAIFDFTGIHPQKLGDFILAEAKTFGGVHAFAQQ